VSAPVNNVILASEPNPRKISQAPNRVGQTRLLVLVVITSNVLGNVFLSRGMHQVGRIVSASPFDYVRAFLNPWAVLGICILVIWMLSDLALLSRADLSFVLPVTASAYVLVALGGHFFLHDHISWERWTGIVLITGGVILAEETPARTTSRPPKDWA